VAVCVSKVQLKSFKIPHSDFFIGRISSLESELKSKDQEMALIKEK